MLFCTLTQQFQTSGLLILARLYVRVRVSLISGSTLQNLSSLVDLFSIERRLETHVRLMTNRKAGQLQVIRSRGVICKC